MLKKMSLAAIALSSVAAFAQTDSNTTTTTTATTTWSSPAMNDRMEKIDTNVSISKKRKIVIQRAREVLSGGDAYIFTGLLDRVSTPIDLALIEGLYNAHRQAVMINEQMLAQRFPTYASVYSTTTTDAMNNSTTTTTSTTWNNDAMAMANDDTQWRPMRWVMRTDTKPKHVDYIRAIEILNDGQDATQQGILSNWWNWDASEREKDVVTRLLGYSAGWSDRTYYPSVYTHRSWTMTTTSPTQ